MDTLLRLSDSIVINNAAKTSRITFLLKEQDLWGGTGSNYYLIRLPEVPSKKLFCQSTRMILMKSFWKSDLNLLGLVNKFPSQHGRNRHNIFDLILGDGEDIPIQNNQISQLSNFDGAFDFLF